MAWVAMFLFSSTMISDGVRLNAGGYAQFSRDELLVKPNAEDGVPTWIMLVN